MICFQEKEEEEEEDTFDMNISVSNPEKVGKFSTAEGKLQ